MRSGSVRGAPDANMFECSDCGFVFLRGASSVDYANGGMNAPAIHEWLTESQKDDERRFASLKSLITGKTVLDVGCGAGGFLYRAATVAKVAGIEPDERVKGHFRSLSDVRQKFDVITLFHVLEHFDDPRTMLKQLRGMLEPGGVIVAEVPNSDDALLSLYQSEPFANFTYWHCHRQLFNAKTISKLAEQAGLKVNSIEHIQRYPLSNHLYWLARGEKNGHWEWRFLDSLELSHAYANSLRRIGKTDTLTGYFRCV